MAKSQTQRRHQRLFDKIRNQAARINQLESALRFAGMPIPKVAQVVRSKKRLRFDADLAKATS